MIPVEPDRRTLPSVLQAQAEEGGDRYFLHDEHGSLTFAEMWHMARRAAAGFSRLGVVKGDRVALALDNRREFLVAWFALSCRGAVEVPINPELRGAPLAHVLNHSEATTVIVEQSVIPEIDAIASELTSLRRVIVVGQGESRCFESLGFAALDCEPEAPADGEVTGADIAALMYTSGTTGPAKGILLPHAQHHMNARQAQAAGAIVSSDVILLCLPLHHNMAQGYGVWPALLSGASVHLLRRFNRRSFWREVDAHRATVFPFVGGLLNLLMESPPSPSDADNSLRVAYGVPIAANLHEEFERRFALTLVHGYGSTEATIPVWSSGPHRTPGAAGRPMTGFDVRVFDPLDREVAPGVAGEICIRPMEPFTMFQGYHRDHERTVAAWRNLWFHSGDRGEFDESGQLWFRGRQSDAIRRFGEFIDPASVEAAIEAVPGVEAVAAYGLASEVAEQEVMVSVVRRHGCCVTAADIRAAVGERLPRSWTPRYVAFVDALPVTATGKVQRQVLRTLGVTELTDDLRGEQKGAG